MIDCIFCEQMKESSVEHIIPKSLGNKILTINNVCKQCNSKMGKNIDGPFVNNPLISMYRYNLKLGGYTGKVPNVFEKGKDSDGKIIYSDNHFRPKLVPEVVNNDRGFSISAGSKEEAYEIGVKKLKRLGAAESEIINFVNELENTEVQIVQPKVHYKFEVNFQDIEIGFLKIAYELTYKLIGKDYDNDDLRSDIRSVLHSFMEGEIVDYNHLISQNSLDSEKVKEILKSLGKIHMIIPTVNSYNQLLLSILLFNGGLFYNVLVSEDAKKYPELKMNPILVRIES